MKQVYIYTLAHPTTKEIRYVGKTTNIKRRLKAHLSRIGEYKSKKNSWIKSLLNQNLNPEIEILDVVFESEWQYWEEFYIGLFKSWSFRLVNGTKGGDGNTRWQEFHTQATKDKISKAHKGKIKSEKHRLNIGKALQGNSNAKDKSKATRTTHKGFINKEVILLDKNKIVVSKYPSGLDYLLTYSKNPYKESGMFHRVCRTKGKKSWLSLFPIYTGDLLQSYNIGDKVLEIELRLKLKPIKIIDVITNKEKIYKSKESVAQCLKVSTTTINNYLKSKKVLLNRFKIESHAS